MDIKTILMIAAFVVQALVFFWKGGEISNQFESLQVSVQEMKVQMASVLSNQAESSTQRTVHGERIENNRTRLNKHDARLDLMEQSNNIRNRKWKEEP